MTEYSHAIAHHAERITALEDLLRRNEDSLGTVLGRMKEAELTLNNFHHALTKIGPEVAVHSEEVYHMKRKLGLVDQSWQTKAKEIDEVVAIELRGIPRNVSSGDPTISRMTGEMKAMHADLQETINQVRRLSEVSTQDGRLTKQNYEEMKWIADQMREHGGNFREVITAQEARNQRYEQQMGMMKKEIEGALGGVKQLIDAVVMSTSEEIIARVESEAKKRGILQSEVGTVVTALRDEFSNRFTEMAEQMRSVEDSRGHLETVLRAEIKSRVTAYEQSVRRLDVVEERLRSEALGAAHYLKDLDAQVARALQDVQEVTTQDSRARIEAMQQQLTSQMALIARDIPSRGDIEEMDAKLNMRFEEQMRALQAHGDVFRGVSSRGGDDMIVHETVIKKLQDHTGEMDRQLSMLGGTLEKIVQRIESSEQKTVIVAEALKDVHEDLVEKFERVEAQSMAVDALLKSLEQRFENDQEAMARQVRLVRSQLKAAEENGMVPYNADGDKSSNGAPGKKGNDGDDTDFYELHRQLTELRRLYDREIAELKARMEQLSARANENEKGMQDELTAIRNETQNSLTRMETTDGQLAEKIRSTTTTTNQNFDAIEQSYNGLKDRVEQLGSVVLENNRALAEISRVQSAGSIGPTRGGATNHSHAMSDMRSQQQQPSLAVDAQSGVPHAQNRIASPSATAISQPQHPSPPSRPNHRGSLYNGGAGSNGIPVNSELSVRRNNPPQSKMNDAQAFTDSLSGTQVEGDHGEESGKPGRYENQTGVSDAIHY